MAYPFTQLPTLGEFINHVTSLYGAKIIKPDGEICGPLGEVEIKSLVIAKENSNPLFATIPSLSNNDVLLPTVLRSLCRQLGIPPEEFGLYLG